MPVSGCCASSHVADDIGYDSRSQPRRIHQSQSICDPLGVNCTAFRVLSLPSVLCKYLKLRASADSIPSALTNSFVSVLGCPTQFFRSIVWVHKSTFSHHSPRPPRPCTLLFMTDGLIRYYGTTHLHFITC